MGRPDHLAARSSAARLHHLCGSPRRHHQLHRPHRNARAMSTHMRGRGTTATRRSRLGALHRVARPLRISKIGARQTCRQFGSGTLQECRLVLSRSLFGQLATHVPHRAFGAGVTGDRHACLGTIDAVAKHHRQGAAHHRLAQQPALHGFGCRQASHRQQRLIAFACGQHHLTAADGKHATVRSNQHLAVGDRLHIGDAPGARRAGRPVEPAGRADRSRSRQGEAHRHARPTSHAGRSAAPTTSGRVRRAMRAPSMPAAPIRPAVRHMNSSRASTRTFRRSGAPSPHIIPRHISAAAPASCASSPATPPSAYFTPACRMPWLLVVWPRPSASRSTSSAACPARTSASSVNRPATPPPTTNVSIERVSLMDARRC